MIAAVLEEQLEAGKDVNQADLGNHLFEAEEYDRAIPVLGTAADKAYAFYAWRQAATLYDRQAEACRQTEGTEAQLLQTLKLSGQAHFYLVDTDKAQERYEELLERSRAAGEPEGEADAQLLLSDIETRAGRFETAQAACQRALECLSAGSEGPIHAQIYLTWGGIDFELGKLDQAQEHFDEALRVLQAHDPERLPAALNNLAVLATVRGDLQGAMDLYERLLAQLDENNPPPQIALTYCNMGMLRIDQERWDEAIELFDRSMEWTKKAHLIIQEPVVLLNRAEALAGKGELPAARAALSQALRAFRRLGDALGVADALRLLGRICRLEHNWKESGDYLTKSIDLNRQFGESVSLGEALFEMGLLKREEGQGEAALEPLREAEGIFSRTGATPDFHRVRALQAEIAQDAV